MTCSIHGAIGAPRWSQLRIWLAIALGGVLVALSTATAQDEEELWSALPEQTLALAPHSVRELVFSPDSRLLAITHSVVVVALWDISTSTVSQALPHPNVHVFGSAFGPDGSRIITASTAVSDDFDSFATIWSVEDGEPLHFLSHPTRDSLYAAAFSRDGELVVTGCEDGQARIWNANTGTFLLKLPHEEGVRVAFFLQDPQYVVTETTDGVMRIWNLNTGTARDLASTQADYMVPSWDMRLFATGHADGLVRIWDVESGSEIDAIQTHEMAVRALTFSPDGRYIATGSLDTKAKLWRRDTGAELRTYHGHTNNVNAVAFSPDGLYLATGSRDQTVKLWKRSGEPTAPTVGSTGTFDLSLGVGLNMISMPVRPETPLTASSFLDKLGGTMMVRLSQEAQQFEAFLPNSGFGDGFAIRGGEGYIVNVTEPTTVPLTGTVWVNAPAREATAASDPWAYVVAGTAPIGRRDSPHAVVIENPRTGARATASVREDGRFITALVDMNRQPVASVGDELMVWAADGDGRLVSRRVAHRVSAADAASATVRVALQAAPMTPSEPLLLANFPNPFNPETWIPFALAESGPVTFTIYDVNGRAVRTLHLGDLPAAWYDYRDTAAHWDGRNDAGEMVGSGVYIAELDAGGTQTRQRMLMRK